jgi:hypothetical protein
MATLYQEIAEKVLKKLADSKSMEPERIEQLRILLSEGKKAKADEFVKIFSAPVGGDLK